MKHLFLSILFYFILINVKGQNLISNPNFEQRLKSGQGCFNGQSISFSDSFTTIPFDGCIVKDWIRISETPDGFWYTGNDFPMNNHSDYIYPHSDSVCVGGFYLFHGMGGSQTTREIIEGKLTKPLITNHHYQFSMYVQLFDTIDGNVIDIGKIVGVNSFSAVFTDTMIPSHNYLPINNYKPQVQINQMVTDTQHWILLMDTFVAKGGEQFVSIGNFKPDSLIQYQLVDSIRNLAIASYYYMDDVSLIDLDDVGIAEIENRKLSVYPNPTKDKLIVSGYQFVVNTIEVTDLLGRTCIIPPLQGGKGDLIINIETLSNGIYFIKATDIQGNVRVGKFVKE